MKPPRAGGRFPRDFRLLAADFSASAYVYCMGKLLQFRDDGQTRARLSQFAKDRGLRRPDVYLAACRIGADALMAAQAVEQAAENHPVHEVCQDAHAKDQEQDHDR